MRYFCGSFTIPYLAAAILLGLPNLLLASTGQGSNCAACHTPTSGKSAVVPPASPDYLGLRSFDVVAGGTVALQVKVNANVGTDFFAVALTGDTNGDGAWSTVPLKPDGSLAGLVFNLDPEWRTRGNSTTTTQSQFYAKYVVEPHTASSGTNVNFPGSAADPDGIVKTYLMAVGASTPSDYYPLVFRTAGGSQSAPVWSNSENFYLHVISIPEPSTIALIALGLAGAVGLHQRRRRGESRRRSI